MVKTKRGIIRLLEAVIAILILAGVLLLVYTNQVNDPNGPDEYILNLQLGILSEIASQESLRNAALSNNSQELESYAAQRLPQSLNFSIIICQVNVQCSAPDIDANLFVEEKLISGNLTDYNPILVKLFVWEIS